MQELKPCPFCECSRIGVECSDGGPALRKLTYNARCHNCMASCAGYGTRELAIYHWNKRSPVRESGCDTCRGLAQISVMEDDKYIGWRNCPDCGVK